MRKIVFVIMTIILNLVLLSCVEITIETTDQIQDNYLLTLNINVEDVFNGSGVKNLENMPT